MYVSMVKSVIEFDEVIAVPTSVIRGAVMGWLDNDVKIYIRRDIETYGHISDRNLETITTAVKLINHFLDKLQADKTIPFAYDATIKEIVWDSEALYVEVRREIESGWQKYSDSRAADCESLILKNAVLKAIRAYVANNN